MEGHEFAKRLNPSQKVLVKDLTNQNVDPQNIISIIRKQDPRCASTVKNVYNEQQRQRVSLHGNKSSMQVLFTLLANAGLFPYLYDTWLKPSKEKFVSAWCDKHLNFGNHTTNRVESQHSLLKRHLRNSKSTLEKFPIIIDRMVKLQVANIKSTFEHSQNILHYHHKRPIFSLLLRKISREALDLIAIEVGRVNALHGRPCGCLKRSGWGLPCAYFINACMNNGVPIPLHSVNALWMKLDLGSSLAPRDNDTCIDDVLDTLKHRYNVLPKVQQKIWTNKIRALWNHGETIIEEPEILANTRVRPTKAQQMKKQNLAKHGLFVVPMSLQFTVHM
ncbi:uncharacterized protein LOC143615527 [Bidens hawaiensis]|uniref:uncharacterized protein LOC143609300 n=1 Tax=Bidens hawaiensis TaxID=980011 RepID=UPI0040494F5E